MSAALPNYSMHAAEPARYQAARAQTEPSRALESRQQRQPVRALEARVRRYNSDIRTDSSTFRAAVLLLAGVEFGQNIDVLARRTGYDRAFVAKCARRLIDNGVWVGGNTVSEWTPDDEASGAFWNDVAVAEGKLCRRVGGEGRIEWAPAGYWKKSYDFVGPRGNDLSTVYRDPASQPPVEEETTEAEAPGAAASSDEPASDAAQESAVEPSAEADEPGTSPESPPRQRPPSPTELFPDAVWLG